MRAAGTRTRRTLIAGVAIGAVAAFGSSGLGTASGATSPRPWRIMKSPAIASDSRRSPDVRGVSCVEHKKFCVAVGARAFVETWSGAPPRWKVTRSPRWDTPIAPPLFDGVSCSAPTFCVAVGHFDLTRGGAHARAAIQTWRGKAWSITKSPKVSTQWVYDTLLSVSCTSPSFCAAVGATTTSSHSLGALIEMFDGVRWTAVPRPKPPEGVRSFLTSVSCPSATDCLAVGGWEEPGNAHMLVMRWDGVEWTELPGRAGVRSIGLMKLSCVDLSFCVVAGAYVGKFNGQPIGMWDGTQWRFVAAPKTGRPYAYASAVSCSSRTRCFTVGYATNGIHTQDARTVVFGWNGTRWSQVPSENMGPTERHYLQDVSCVAAGCIAVGQMQSNVERTSYPPVILTNR